MRHPRFNIHQMMIVAGTAACLMPLVLLAISRTIVEVERAAGSIVVLGLSVPMVWLAGWFHDSRKRIAGSSDQNVNPDS